jgi:hypothetical protein
MQEENPALRTPDASSTGSSSTSSREDMIASLVVEIHSAVQGNQLESAQQVLAQYHQSTATTTTATSSASAALALMQWLAVRLFLPPNPSSKVALETQEDASLQVILFLVQCQPQMYLTAASTAIVQRAVHLSLDGTQPMHISTLLRQVLVQQMTLSESAQVRTDATKTLIACTRKVGPTLVLIPAISELVQGCWTIQLENSTTASNTNKAQASTIAVRCASTMVELWMAMGDVALTASLTATELLVQMLQDDSDPLVQLSILDLLEGMATRLATPEAVAGGSSTYIQTRQWMLSSTIVTPLCQLCGVTASSLENAMEIDQAGDSKEEVGMIDPLLGGSALNLLSALCAIFHSMAVVDGSNEEQPENQQQYQWLLGAFYRALLQFVTSSSFTDEAERLALVHAISNFCSASSQALQMVLDNPQVRDAWLSIQQVSKPKLQAAILVSVAMVLDPNLVVAGSFATSSESYQPPQPVVASRTTPTTTTSAIPHSNVRSTTRITPTAARNLYNMLGYVNTSSQSSASTTNWLLTTGRKALSPFPEVRIATYAILTAIATIGPTGVMLLAQADGGWTTLETFLLNRNVETSRDGRLARFELVAAVYRNAPPGLLSEVLLNKLKLHLQQGPHYVQPLTWDVMVAE